MRELCESCLFIIGDGAGAKRGRRELSIGAVLCAFHGDEATTDSRLEAGLVHEVAGKALVVGECFGERLVARNDPRVQAEEMGPSDGCLASVGGERFMK